MKDFTVKGEGALDRLAAGGSTGTKRKVIGSIIVFGAGGVSGSHDGGADSEPVHFRATVTFEDHLSAVCRVVSYNQNLWMHHLSGDATYLPL